MNKKRIILVRNAQPYDFGGGERFPVFLAAILQKNNFSPLLVSRSPTLLAFAAENAIQTQRGWWWSRQNWSGTRVLLTPLYLVWQCALFVWYLQLFIRHRPLAVHLQSKDDFIAGTFAARVVGARVIWTDHADLKHVWQNLRVWYKNPIGKLVYLAAHITNAITLVSQSELALISAHIPSGSVTDKLQVIYNGVTDSQAMYSVEPPNKPFTFCVASRLVTDKGIHEVIAAFDRLSHDYPDSQLQLLGDGPEAGKFKAEAGHNNQIIFMGHQTEPLRYIANADVFVHPTYHEGFSVALVEASMLGRPIIATAVGGNVEIIQDDRPGLLVEAKHVDSLYEAMKRLRSDADLRMRLGSAARKQYEARFMFDAIVMNEFVPLYRGEKI